jgi:VNT family MFS transporter (synaptic vesicle glycoprotein 2)
VSQIGSASVARARRNMAKISRNCYSLDDAIVRAQFGKFNYILIALSGIVLTSGMLEATSIGMVLPIAECELNLSNTHKGFLGSISYIGIIVSSHFWGFMADTRGRRKVLVPALFFASFFTLISSFATSFWTLTLCRFLNGFW